MVVWPADSRAFSRPTSKAREKRPGDEVVSCLDAKIALVPKHQRIAPSTLLAPVTDTRRHEATKPQRYIRPNHWHVSYFQNSSKTVRASILIAIIHFGVSRWLSLQISTSGPVKKNSRIIFFSIVLVNSYGVLCIAGSFFLLSHMASTPALRHLRINQLQLGVTEHEFVLISICSVRIKEFMVGIMVSWV